jgi:ribulose 1,5-bisphosphate synthetase/thiazole synthase
MRGTDTLLSLDDVNKIKFDVLVVGSGPAGVAVVEQIYTGWPDLKVGVIERGGIILFQHFNNVLSNNRRRKFLETYREKPWAGDMNEA